MKTMQDILDAYNNREIISRCAVCGDVTASKIGDRMVTYICSCDKAKAEAEEKARSEAERMARHRRRVARLRETGLMEKDAESCTFEADDLSNPRITSAMKSYVEQWDTFREKGIGLLLYGKVGTGKTFSACCVANALLEKEVPVLVSSFARIANTAWGIVKDKQAYFDSIQDCELLVIDDLGVERKSEYMQEIVFQVIDGRIRQGKPMIITTNLTLAEMKNTTDLAYQRIYSRILQACHPVLVDGNDRRREATRKQYEDIQLMLGL